MVLTTNEIRAIRALRAGPLTHEQATERWSSGTADLYSLARAGLAEKVGEEFRITTAGRAACPPVNQLLAAVPAKPKEVAMLINCNSYKDVVAAIAAAGPSGLTRKQLADKFAADSRADLTRIDAHIFYALTRIDPPAIAKLKPGHYVAAEFAPDPESAELKLRAAIKRITTPPTAAAGIPEEEVATHARDYAEMIDFDIEEAQSVDVTAGHMIPEDAGEMPGQVDRDAETPRQARKIVELQAVVDNLLNALDARTSAKDAVQARVRELEGRLGANAAGAGAGVCYAVAFASDFHASIESAVSQAVRDYDEDSIKEAVVVACTPVGGIALRPVFVPTEYA